MWLRGVCACLTVAVLAAVVAPADARRDATKAERLEILRAAHRTAGDACSLYPVGYCKEVVRISTVRKSWSAVYIRPTKRAPRGTVQNDVATMRRVDGRWTLHQEGNGGGCGVPPAVRRDLNLNCY